MIIPITIIAVVLLDQLTKYLIRTNFQIGETLPIISDVLHLTYVRNRGAAFSMFENMHFVTIVVPVVIISLCVAALIYFRDKLSKQVMFFVSLIIAGGIGNLIDRVALGYVTDMIDFRVFPVFNVADIAVCTGCALILVYELFFEKEEDKLIKKSEGESYDRK